MGNEGYVLTMYTIPPWRGRGIARALLEEIIKYVKRTGTPHLWLYATDAGRPLYEQAGFVVLPDAMGLQLFPTNGQPLDRNVRVM